MKNPILILNAVKRMLGQEVKLERMLLEDGTTEIEAEAFDVGAPVFIVSEDGNIPLPVGEYTLQDGQVVVVAEDGVIAEMKASAEAGEEEMAKDESYATKEDLANAISEIKSMFSEHIAKETPKKEVKVEAAKVEKVELSTEPAAAKAIKPNPDRETPKAEAVILTKNAPRTKTDDMISILNNLNLK